MRLNSTEALRDYPLRLTDRLQHWADRAPDRVFAAQRRRDGAQVDAWSGITYAQMIERVQRIGQALTQRDLSPQRPIAILSGNDIDHLALAWAAAWVGVPVAPISPAYSLVSQDHAKLRRIIDTLTPGLVFAAGPHYARAIAAAVPAQTEVVLAQGELTERRITPAAALYAAAPVAAVHGAHAGTGPDTIVKFLFTSGSTREPKGVIHTHRMLCSNQQMVLQAFAFLADEPPVLVDWLPWHHTFGGNHNVGIALYNGGTLYIDEGRPTEQGMVETLRNLREIAPTVYFNVPKGFEEIARALDHDDRLRQTLFSRVKAFMFAGAGLSQAVWDRLDDHAVRSIGVRVRMLTGLGMTETSPSCTFALSGDVHSGCIGLPCPGVDVKLVPRGHKTEILFRGPHVMPGYWRAPQASAQAFDEEGYYRSGDAVCWVDPTDPQRGLKFDGRLAEDFKLATGTFVSVGPLRLRVVLLGAPYVQDAVLVGPDRNDLGLLIFPRIEDCRTLAGLAAAATAQQVLQHGAVRHVFQALLDRLWSEGTGSSNRVARAVLLLEPPCVDHGEITDKGSINQQAVLMRRAALVDDMYAGTAPQLLTSSLPQGGLH